MDAEETHTNVPACEHKTHDASRLCVFGAQYKTAFENASIGMALAGPDNHFVQVNDAFCRMLGYTKKELLAKTCKDITHPDDLKIHRDTVKRLLAGETNSCQIEKRYIHKENRAIWVRLNMSVVRDKKGEPLYFVSQIEDITLRRQAETQLRIFNELIDQSSDGIFVIDARTGKFVDTNHQACKQLGYTREEILKIGMHDIEAVLPGTRSWEERVNEVRKRGHIISKGVNMRKDGTTFPVEINVKFVNYDNKDYLVAIMRDITEREQAEESLRESEERFRKIFEQSTLGMALVGTDYTFIKVNERLCEMLGYAKNELERKKFTEITHAEDIEKDLRLAEQVFKGTIPFYRIDKRYVKKNGESIWINLTASVIRDKDGAAQYGLAMVEDISARKKAEEERKKLRAQIEQYALQLEKKVAKLERKRASLTKREKFVLTALACNPHYHDPQLAQLTGLKRSTVTAIRNRLEKENWYRSINIPDLNALGCKILCFVLYHHPETGDKQAIARVFKPIQEMPQCVFFHQGASAAMALCVHTDMSDAHAALKNARETAGSEELNMKMQHARFFLPATTIQKFFDYTSILKSRFGLEWDKERVAARENDRLSKTEKELLYAFTKFPAAGNQEIQRLTRISAPTIIKAKKRLFRRGFIRRAIIPNMKKLGFSFSSCIYQKFGKPDYDQKSFRKLLARQNAHAFLSMLCEEHFLLLNVYEEYEQLERDSIQKKDLYQRTFTTLQNPQVVIWDTVQMNSLRFAQVIKESLHLDVRY